MRLGENRKISVAIPCYNSADYLIDALRVPLLDDRIDEIVLLDDGSGPDQLKLAEGVLSGPTLMGDLRPQPKRHEARFASHDLPSLVSKKVKAHALGENVGAYTAKALAVGLCKNEWVFLLDSDNYLLHSSIDSLFSYEWDPKSCYYSSYQIRVKQDGRSFYDSHLGYHGWVHLGNAPIDMRRFGEIVEAFDSMGEDFGCGGLGSFLNQGNFFVNKDMYTSVIDSVLLACDPKGFDAGSAMISWLMKGNNITLVPGLIYIHRMRDDSLYTTTGEYSGTIATYALAQFMKRCSGIDVEGPPFITFKDDTKNEK